MVEREMRDVGVSKAQLWTGWVLSALSGLFLLSSGVNVARKASFVMETFSHLGYSDGLAVGIGVTEFICTVLYLIPRTAVFGVVLLTAYLGGAAASHIRVGDSPLPPVIVAVVLWIGLLLRDPKLRTLFPIRK